MSAATMRITTIFCDCGGVLLTNGWDHHARRRVAEYFGLNYDEFEQHHEQPNDQWERGKITLHDYLQQVVFYAPRSFSEDDFIAQMRAASQVLYPQMIDFLHRLRGHRTASGTPGMYLLSNESRELMEYRIPKFGLTGLFDAYLVSSYIGLRKPDLDFFECALSISQRQPAQCVFVDDREENVAAARTLGLHAIRLETPQQAIAEMEQLGITAG